MQKALSIVDTAVGKKALVAITGLALYGFVIGHIAGNLQIFLPNAHEALDAYGAMLHGMPKLLWAARIVLLLAIVVHITLTIQLASQNTVAKGGRYKFDSSKTSETILQKYARKTMILSGPIVAAYIVFHLLHLTVGANVIPGYQMQHGHVYENLVYGFRVWWVAGMYMFANILLSVHLFHGGQALLQTLGLRHPSYDKRANMVALALALFVGLSNVLIPLSVLTRVVGSELPDAPDSSAPYDQSAEMPMQ